MNLNQKISRGKILSNLNFFDKKIVW